MRHTRFPGPKRIILAAGTGFLICLFAACARFQMWPGEPSDSAVPGPGVESRVERDVTYGTAGGVDLKMDIHVPAKGASPYPVVVIIHGGAWQSGDKGSIILPVLPELLRRGYLVA